MVKEMDKVIAINHSPFSEENKNFTEKELLELCPYVELIQLRIRLKEIRLILNKKINTCDYKIIIFKNKKDTIKFYNLFKAVIKLNGKR